MIRSPLALIAAALAAVSAAPTTKGAAPADIPPTVFESPAPVVNAPPNPAASPSQGLLGRMTAVAPEADPAVLALALEARACAARSGTGTRASRMAVIDYSRPSTERRLWVFDLASGKLLYDEHVAHGQGSGANLANAFSNNDGSHQTSLGLFTTAETYHGNNGYSLRMDGHEPGVNDNARRRAIVMHGAPYVNPKAAPALGRLGRSHGCPAVRPDVARPIIDTLKGGQLVFSYYPDPKWLKGSRFLGCSGAAVAAGGGQPLNPPNPLNRSASR